MVRLKDFTMDYCKFGEGEKAFVILPGLSVQSVMGSAGIIEQAYHVFAKDYTVYVMDYRKELPDSYSVADNARDTAQALRAMGIEHACFLGASYGGMTAMEIAIKEPSLVDKLVISSTSANVTEEEYNAIESWVSLARQGDAEKLYLAFGESVYPREAYEQSIDLLTQAAKTVTQEELARFIKFGEGIKGFNVMDRLDQIKCPVFVIGDKQDKVLGTASTQALISRLGQRPGSASYLYDGYGHAVYDMAPDFKERMLNFFG